MCIGIHKYSNMFKYPLPLTAITIRNRYYFYRRDIYFWIFSSCETCDVSGKFHCGIIQGTNPYFVRYFDKKVPEYKYIILLCIQFACEIVQRMGKLSKDGLFEMIQNDLSI